MRGLQRIVACTAAVACAAALHVAAEAAAVASARQLQVNGALRLVGGHTASMGYLQAYVNGEWGTVCNGGFSVVEGHVACQLLGYSHAVGVASGSRSMRVTVASEDSYYAIPVESECETPILWDDVDCFTPQSGSSVPRCTFRNRQWGSEDCKLSENVFLGCTHSSRRLISGSSRPGTPSGCMPSSTRFRLTGSGYPDRGRLEVSYDGSCRGQSITSIYSFHGCSASAPTGSIWGSVCDDDFRNEDAHAVCQTLGYRGASLLRSQATTGSGNTQAVYPVKYRPYYSVPVVLDGVDCRSATPQQAGGSILAACSTRTPSEHSCGHSKDVTLFCADNVPVKKSSIPRSTYSGPTRDHPGAVPDDDSDDSAGSSGPKRSRPSAGFQTFMDVIIPILFVVTVVVIAVRAHRARPGKPATPDPIEEIPDPSPASAPKSLPQPDVYASKLQSVAVSNPLS